MTCPPRIGPHSIARRLARGGMAEIFLTKRRGDDPPRIIKRPLPSLWNDAEIRTLFIQEARLMSYLEHPNLVRTLGAGVSAEGLPYLELEWVNGLDLRQVLRLAKKAGVAMPPVAAALIGQAVAEALVQVHACHDDEGRWLGLVHGDVSSKNVILGSDGRVVLLDLGVASVDAWPAPIQPGKLRGTWSAMSPEQTRGERLDCRSDLFALGSLIHEMIAGVPPFERENAVKTLFAVRDEAPPALVSAPQPLRNLISWCLEKPLHRRCSSAEDLARCLWHVIPSVPSAARALQGFLASVCWPERPDEAPTMLMPKMKGHQETVSNRMVTAA